MKYLKRLALVGLCFLWLSDAFGQELARFRAHQRSKGINEALISPKSNFILSAGKDSTAQLFDMAGKLLHTFKHEKEDVKAIAFSPDEKLIATGGNDEKVQVWQVSNKKLAYSIAFDNTIMDVQFSPDGKYLVVSEQRNRLRIYEAQKGKFVREITYKANWTKQIAISPQSDKIAFGFGAGMMAYFTFPEGKPINVFDDLQYEPEAIAPVACDGVLFSPDGKEILAWQDGNFNQVITDRMHRWNAQDATHQQAYKGLVGDFDMAYTPNGQYLLMGGYTWQDKDFSENTGTLHLLEAKTGTPLAQIQAHKLGITSIDCSKDGKYILTAGGENREIILWDAPKVLALRNITQNNNTQKSINTTQNKPKERVESVDLGDINLSEEDSKYYALIISVSDYQDKKIKKLEHPPKDATKVKNVLEKYYTFEPTHVVQLQNPTRAQIITELDKLSRSVTEADNLLIFYAGHGYWDETLQQGYWLPADAQADFRANWFANSELGNYIKGIKSKHTLLVTDACFSGSIFENTRSAFDSAPQHIQNLYERGSRKAMTSGMKEEVPDKSIFLEYLVKGLEANSKKYLTAGELFNYLIEPVLSNTSNAPQFGVIRNTKHEGGDFIFIKK